MKIYNVRIVAEDAQGKEVRFIKVVAFPVSGTISEGTREATAIGKVESEYPHLRNVRAEGSRHRASDDDINYYAGWKREP